MDLQLIHVSLLNEHERFNKTKCNFAGGQWPDLTLTSEPEISELVLHFMAFLSEIFKNQKGRLKQRHDRHLAGKSTRDDSLARNTLVSTLMSIIGKFGFEIYLTNWNDFSQFNKKRNWTLQKIDSPISSSDGEVPWSDYTDQTMWNLCVSSHLVGSFLNREITWNTHDLLESNWPAKRCLNSDILCLDLVCFVGWTKVNRRPD